VQLVALEQVDPGKHGADALTGLVSRQEQRREVASCGAPPVGLAVVAVCLLTDLQQAGGDRARLRPRLRGRDGRPRVGAIAGLSGRVEDLHLAALLARVKRVAEELLLDREDDQASVPFQNRADDGCERLADLRGAAQHNRGVRLANEFLAVVVAERDAVPTSIARMKWSDIGGPSESGTVMGGRMS
jgi:hypothetical protein